MATLHFKSKSELDKEIEHLTANSWFVYMTWQASDGSWHCIVYEGTGGKAPW